MLSIPGYPNRLLNDCSSLDHSGSERLDCGTDVVQPLLTHDWVSPSPGCSDEGMRPGSTEGLCATFRERYAGDGEPGSLVGAWRVRA
jgi:hypothetical protein